MIRLMTALDRLKTLFDQFRPPDVQPRRRRARATGRGGRQVAGLVIRRRKDRQEVLLVTSRDSLRWIAPKGWVEGGEDGAEAAMREVWEEAGVIARPTGEALGSYDYVKERQRGDLHCSVDVYLLELVAEKSRWPEMKHRKRRWVTVGEAPDVLEEPGLADLLRASALYRDAA